MAEEGAMPKVADCAAFVIAELGLIGGLHLLVLCERLVHKTNELRRTHVLELWRMA
jgi:hypothetical protein